MQAECLVMTGKLTRHSRLISSPILTFHSRRHDTNHTLLFSVLQRNFSIVPMVADRDPLLKACSPSLLSLTGQEIHAEIAAKHCKLVSNPHIHAAASRHPTAIVNRLSSDLILLACVLREGCHVTCPEVPVCVALPAAHPLA